MILDIFCELSAPTHEFLTHQAHTITFVNCAILQLVRMTFVILYPSACTHEFRDLSARTHKI